MTPGGGMSPVNPALPAGPANPVIVNTPAGPVAVDPTSGTATAVNPTGAPSLNLSPFRPGFTPNVPGLTPFPGLDLGGLAAYRGSLSRGAQVSGYPRFGADPATTTTPSLLDRAKTFLTAQNATVNVKNGYLLAGAAVAGLVVYEMMGKKGKRR